MWVDGFREAQEQAIPLILDARRDVIIAASTATGKTEAAFFPILTRLARLQTSGIALYISPLKALINDQLRRLAELTDLLDIPLTPWHGDMSQSRKTSFLKKPEGCLLITPESLEAILMGHGHGLGGRLAGLQYVVVDELHAFMGTERGKQLQSLLHRVEKAVGRYVCRVGLSATLGDMQGAANFLRPGKGGDVALVDAKEGGQELRVLVKGVVEPDAPPRLESGSDETSDGPAALAVVNYLLRFSGEVTTLCFPTAAVRWSFTPTVCGGAARTSACPTSSGPTMAICPRRSGRRRKPPSSRKNGRPRPFAPPLSSWALTSAQSRASFRSARLLPSLASASG